MNPVTDHRIAIVYESNVLSIPGAVPGSGHYKAFEVGWRAAEKHHQVGLANISRCIQLHESLEIDYTMSHYAVRLLTQDGARIVLDAIGKSVDDALENLDRQLSRIELDELRAFKGRPNPAY